MSENTVKFKVTVIEKTGKCIPGYEEGDVFYFNGLDTPEKPFCGASFHVLFPYFVAMKFGAKMPFANEDGSIIVACPDKAYIKYKIEKEGV